MALLNEVSELDEDSPGVFRHTQHLKKIAYRESGNLLRMNQDWENSGISARPHKIDRAPIMVSAGEDGMRRIHPTREIDRYLEIGAPFVKTGGVWGQVNLGTPTRTGSRLQWTRPQADMYVDFGGHFVKLAILLKGGFVPEDNQIAFPVGLNGLTRSGFNILRDGVPIGNLNLPKMVDLSDPGRMSDISHQITNIAGQPYWLLTLPDISSFTQPVIDPTLTLQPDPTDGLDTYIVDTSPTINSGSDVFIWSGERNDSNPKYRTLIKFDLSTLPANSIISSAIFSWYVTNDFATNARTHRLYRVKRAWLETQATWNIWTTGNNWSTAGAFHVDDCEQTEVASRAFTATETLNQFKDFPFTGLTTKSQLDLGNGWLIKADTEVNDAYAGAASGDTTASERPKFVVVYTLPTAPTKFMFYQRRRK